MGGTVGVEKIRTKDKDTHTHTYIGRCLGETLDL